MRQNKPECSSLGFIGMLGNNTPCISLFTALSPQPWELCAWLSCHADHESGVALLEEAEWIGTGDLN